MIFTGWTIARAIPYKYLAGLLTGQYTLTGGVIRHAAGTANAGQIISHLLPASSNILNMIPGLNFIPGIVANVQLYKMGGSIDILSGKMDSLAGITHFNKQLLVQLSSQVTSLSQVTQNILHVAAGTALLSGLSLAVSSIGFIGLNKKLNTIDGRLKEIQKDVKAIKEILEQTENAKLKVALKDLIKIDKAQEPKLRNAILLSAKKSLAELNEIYQDRLANSTELATAIVHEEYFCLTALAQARCTAELGMLNMAHHEMQDKHTFWKAQARRIANDLLIGKHPERFLASDFAHDVPVSAIASWLDFASGEKKEYGWIDELRRQIDEPWYKSSITGFMKGGGLNKAIGVGLEKEREIVIPTLQKFLARDNIFEGYTAQYEMLEHHNTKPSELEQKIAQLPESAAIGGHYILQPEKVA